MQPDILFLALTRPALTWGVPFEALVCNFVFWFVAGAELMAPTWWRQPMMFWAMAIPTHYALRMLTGWDYHWFRSVKLEMLTVSKTHLESLSIAKARSWREVPSSV